MGGVRLRDGASLPLWIGHPRLRRERIARSGPVAGRHTGPGPISRLLARHPRLPLIVAHMGMPEYAEFLDLADRYPEVRLDTTIRELVPMAELPDGSAGRRSITLEDLATHRSGLPTMPPAAYHPVEPHGQPPSVPTAFERSFVVYIALTQPPREGLDNHLAHEMRQWS